MESLELATEVRVQKPSHRPGLVKLVIRHEGTAAQSAFSSRAARMKVVAPRAGQGARGTYVLLLQRGLRRLGFAVPVTGLYDGGTSRAVLAFRKTNGLGRNGYADRRVFSLVLRGRGAFRVRYPRAGTPRGVRLVAAGARADRRRPRAAGLPCLLRQALDSHRVRHLPLLHEATGHQLARHGGLQLLRRRVRRPRLSVGAELRSEPRMHSGADPERGGHQRSDFLKGRPSSSTAEGPQPVVSRQSLWWRRGFGAAFARTMPPSP